MSAGAEKQEQAFALAIGIYCKAWLCTNDSCILVLMYRKKSGSET